MNTCLKGILAIKFFVPREKIPINLKQTFFRHMFRKKCEYTFKKICFYDKRRAKKKAEKFRIFKKKIGYKKMPL
jgi:hypothetical protein